MTVARFGPVLSSLRRAGLVTVLLSLAAAMLALHTLAGAHATAADTPVLGGPSIASIADSAHSPVSVSGGNEAGGRSSCFIAADCPDMSHRGSSCVLSAAKASMSAQPPVAAFDTRSVPRTDAARLHYVYLGAAPSPGDFCISRT
jgi:hypothetical protein